MIITIYDNHKKKFIVKIDVSKRKYTVRNYPYIDHLTT